MRVMVMVKATEDSEAGRMPSTELLTAMMNYNEELVKAGVMIAGEGLKPSSAAVRIHFDGPSRTVIDGPFAETKELVAGFWIWEVESMEHAIEWAKKCPNPMFGPSDLDIRPFIQFEEDFPGVMTDEIKAQEERVRAEGEDKHGKYM
jgi:hypothetical protein